MTQPDIEAEATQAYNLFAENPDTLATVSEDGERLYTFVNGVLAMTVSKVNLNKLPDEEIERQVEILRGKYRS